jgi:hypothetical protein
MAVRHFSIFSHTIGFGMCILMNIGCAPREPQEFPESASAENPVPAFPWVRLEAEDATFQGTVLGPSREYLTLSSEAAGRQAVRLEQPGDFLEFEASTWASGLVIRLSLPDHPEGGGMAETLLLSRNGEEPQELAVDSYTAWVYGDFPWRNDPDHGRAHRFFDENRFRISPVKPGDRLRITRRTSSSVPWVVVDFIELEEVPPPLSRPEGSISLADFEGEPVTDHSTAFRRAVTVARDQNRVLWIPPGTYRLEEGPFSLGGLEIRGAGIWHTTLTGRPYFRGTGERLVVTDLAMTGEVDQRIDHRSENAFTENFGEGSRLERLWIERFKCGVWTNFGTRNLTIADSRIRNTMADGVNFCDGTSFSVVRNTHLRNTGDDGLATWSPSGDWSSKQPCIGNRFTGNLIELPWLANGIGIYGGQDHVAEGNRIVDTVYSGAGVLISSGHGALPLEGTIRVRDTVAIRTGGDAYIGESVGALWIFAQEADMTARIEIQNMDLREPADSGVSVHGPFRVADLRLSDVTVTSAGGAGLRVGKDASGSLYLQNLTIRDGSPRILNEGKIQMVHLEGK